MALNKKNLFLGIVIGAVGNSLYESIKKPRKEFIYIKKYNSNHSINNSADFSNRITLNKDNILKHFNELRKQTNLIEEKLNKLKN